MLAGMVSAYSVIIVLTRRCWQRCRCRARTGVTRMCLRSWTVAGFSSVRWARIGTRSRPHLRPSSTGPWTWSLIPCGPATVNWNREINPFMPCRLFCLNFYNWSFFNIRDVWLVFIMTMFYRNSCILFKQCRPWSDAAFYGVWSGSTRFTNVSFMGS